MCRRIAVDSFAWKTNLLVTFMSFLLGSLHAQIKKWDGEGGDGQWNTVSNWTDDILPSGTDSVIFDNSFIPASYNVTLPAGNTTINFRWLILSPSGSTIQLRLPNSNAAVPALNLTGIKLFNGSVFINSSGAASGVVISISDSLYIYNGARFIQNTATGHAAFVSRLSRANGTESGTFEFNVPNASSYTISISGRTYGNLELNSTAAGVPKTYLSGGGQPLTVNGNLFIGTGVSYSLDFTADLIINGHLTNYGIFNLANNPNNNSIKVKKGYYQFGDVTETSTGSPTIELNGISNQEIQVTGKILNSINFRINNSAGATLLAPLTLPHRIELIQGRLTTSSTSPLVLDTNCSILADSMNQSAFINGPLRKLGLSSTSNFLFPVGKGITQRWLALKDASGNLTVEFFKTDPHALSSNLGPGVNHISSIEYWAVASAAPATARIELSFDNVNSGGVTDLSSLRISTLAGTIWTDGGNTAVTGTAGSNGSVTGNDYSFATGDHFLTLASSVSGQNPLPEKVILRVARSGERSFLNWELKSRDQYRHIAVQVSKSQSGFLDMATIPLNSTGTEYSFPILGKSSDLYRLKMGKMDGTEECSNTVAISQTQEGFALNSAAYSHSEGRLYLDISSPKRGNASFIISDQAGRIIKILSVPIEAGNSRLSILVNQLPTGIYHVIGISLALRAGSKRFINP